MISESRNHFETLGSHCFVDYHVGRFLLPREVLVVIISSFTKYIKPFL